uniref:Uncharacterized protein n=1 Tax=Saimiri boliviensis boliviensis TaxID=39432 RepID=A0A2K6TQ87_SAIBB
VGEAEVQDLVRVLTQRLHLHTGHRVIQPLELLQPGLGRCGARTWVSGHVAGHLVEAVELLPPQELVPRHVEPLAAHQPRGQHVGRAQAQEDLVDQAVGEQGRAALVHRDILPGRP